jgi:hypothetical protein
VNNLQHECRASLGRLAALTAEVQRALAARREFLPAADVARLLAVVDDLVDGLDAAAGFLARPPAPAG